MLPAFRKSGAPNPDSVFSNAVLIDSLYHQNVAGAQSVASVFGASLVRFVANPATFPPDYAVLVEGNNILIGFSGTTNKPQWQSHIASSIIPTLDAAVLRLVMQSFYNGTNLVQSDIVGSIGFLGNKTIRITGHSYGGAAAFILALHLMKANPPPPTVEVQTFGEPRSYVGQGLPFEPIVHDRITHVLDPVPYSPPAPATFLGMGKLVGLIKLLGDLSWKQYGEEWQISDGILSQLPPSGFDFLKDLGYLMGATAAGTFYHLMDSQYLPNSKKYWLFLGGSPALANLVPSSDLFTANPYVPPSTIGPAFSPAEMGSGWFPAEPNPVDSGNQIFWEVVSSQAFPSSSGSSTMSQMKGTWLFHLGTGGFSESVYRVGGPATDYNSMLGIMANLLPYRTALSYCEDIPNCQQPLKLFGTRVEDELIPNDSLVQLNQSPLSGYPAPPPASTPIFFQNLEQNDAAKIRFSSSNNTQNAGIYIHGIPVTSIFDSASPSANFDFRRYTTMDTNWIAALKAYADKLNFYGCGFRSLQNIWTYNAPAPLSSKPVSVVYDAGSEQYTFTMAQAPPLGKMRYVLRGFKNMQFLNGRQVGQQGIGPVITILKKFRAVVWDGTGSLCPETWNYWMPNLGSSPPPGTNPGAKFKFIGSKKIGRRFDISPGRARKRAS